MPQTQVSSRHHYIPEFYLKRWAIAGELVEFSKPYGTEVKPKRVSPKQTGWGKWLYALDGLPGEAAQLPELEFFRPVDTRASDVLSKIEHGAQPLLDADRVAWAQFMLSLIFRHPEGVKATKERLFSDLAETSPAEEARWRSLRRDGDTRSMRDAFQHPNSRPAINRLAMRTLLATSSSEKIGTHLINMKWASRRLPFSAPALLTSDRPLIWFGPLENDGCHILMPLGPKRLFWACNTTEMAFSIDCQPPAVLVQFVNEMVVRRAAKFVYGMSDVHLPYVQANMGVAPELTIPDQVVQMRRIKASRRAQRRPRP